MKISASQYAHSWYSLLKKAQDKNAATQSLLTDLHRSGKLKLLPEIMRLMKKIELAERGKTAVQITLAHDLEKNTIEELLARTVGTAPTEVTITHNAALIGGAIIRTENEQWDLTVSGQLAKMRNNLSAQN